MPIASAALPFVTAAGKSGLVSTDRFEALAASRELPESLAARLVAANELTRFQADKLLAGLWQGLRLGPYRVLAPIGRGGMGIVYLAAKGPTNAGPRVAMKILPPRVARDEPRRLERFLREIRIGAALGPHPHLARTFEGGEVSGVHFLAMEYVPGPTLRKRVQDGGPLSPSDAPGLAARLADALAHLHASSVVHRDLTPANVILSPTGAKLLDLGFALVPGEPLPADPRVAGGPGYVIGTMDYIAPEQIRDASAVTPATDLYSLGGTLFFSLTGSPPYPGGDARQKLRWHQGSDPPDVRTINSAVPEWLARLVANLLHKEPHRRPSAVAVRDRIRERTGGGDVVPISVGEETAVEILTHQKVTDEELLEPIIFDDEPVASENREMAPPALFWYLIGGLVSLIAAFAAVFIALLARKT